MKVVCKGGLLVRFSVVVGVFQDDQLIRWTRVARLVMRIARHGGYPKAAFVVKGHLYGIGQVWKLLF